MDRFSPGEPTLELRALAGHLSQLHHRLRQPVQALGLVSDSGIIAADPDLAGRTLAAALEEMTAGFDQVSRLSRLASHLARPEPGAMALADVVTLIEANGGWLSRLVVPEEVGELAGVDAGALEAALQIAFAAITPSRAGLAAAVDGRFVLMVAGAERPAARPWALWAAELVAAAPGAGLCLRLDQRSRSGRHLRFTLRSRRPGAGGSV